MPGLFSPLSVKHLTLRNRIVLPPMANDLSDESGAVTDKHIQHYVRRASAGVGMVIIEHAHVRTEGRISRTQLGIHNDSLIPGLRRLVAAVQETGAVVGIQITHCGGKTSSATAGMQPLAPSALTVPGASEPAQALTQAQMAEIKDLFVAAAGRAVQAGFDFIEIHGAHGYLLNQFFSPLTNERRDEYGGDLEGRLRYPLEVVRAVREAVGHDYLMLYRLGASDFKPGGTTIDEGCQAAQALVAAGIDLMDISGGMCGSQTPDWDRKSQGYFVPMAAAIRSAVAVPVIATGGITDPHAADQFIRDQQIDLVGIGRAMLRNPDWVLDARAALGED